MRASIIKVLVVLGTYGAVLYPLWMRLKDMHWTADVPLTLNLFPLFGLTAFSLLWLHAMSGVFEPWLRRHFDFDAFVRSTSLLIFACIVLHPVLLVLSPTITLIDLLRYGGLYIWLGVIGWLLLLTYDLGKALKRYGFFVRHWNSILLISTVGFLLTFFHSLALGSQLQTGPLRVLWMFYGVSAILATIYTYGIRMPREARRLRN